MGGEANDPQLLSVLLATVPIPVEASMPLHNVKLDRMKPSERRGSLCEWGVALGLGLKLTTTNFAGRTGTSRGRCRACWLKIRRRQRLRRRRLLI